MSFLQVTGESRACQVYHHGLDRVEPVSLQHVVARQLGLGQLGAHGEYVGENNLPVLQQSAEDTAREPKAADVYRRIPAPLHVALSVYDSRAGNRLCKRHKLIRSLFQVSGTAAERQTLCHDCPVQSYRQIELDCSIFS